MVSRTLQLARCLVYPNRSNAVKKKFPEKARRIKPKNVAVA